MHIQKPVETCPEKDSEIIEHRITELETRMAFQEDTLHTLSRQLAHQQTITDQQQRMLQTLYSQLTEMKALSDGEGMAQEMQERPPHY